MADNRLTEVYVCMTMDTSRLDVMQAYLTMNTPPLLKVCSTLELHVTSTV